MPDPSHIAARAGYLSKVLLGLGVLGLEVTVALGLREAVMGTAARQAAMAVLILLMLLQLPLIGRVLRRTDELRQQMHRAACAKTLAWLATGCGIVGVLQAGDLLPVFNQFLTLGVLVAVWGVQLMLADRPHHAAQGEDE